MKNLRYSNIYAAPVRYGPLAGLPAIHLELFGCNLTCSAMNNPKNIPIEFIDTHEGKVDRRKFNVGCSSRFAWDTSYFHATRTGDSQQLAYSLLKSVGPKGFLNKSPIVLVITGGEPLMWQNQLIGLLKALDRLCSLEKVIPPLRLLFETNATKVLSTEFQVYLESWQVRPIDGKKGNREVHFLNSPKLSISGEKPEDAIVPEVITSMLIAEFKFNFIFPTRYNEEDFKEIESYIQKCVVDLQAWKKYYEHASGTTVYDLFLLSCVPYVFPIEVTPATKQAHQYMAMRYGYLYSESIEIRETLDCLS